MQFVQELNAGTVFGLQPGFHVNGMELFEWRLYEISVENVRVSYSLLYMLSSLSTCRRLISYVSCCQSSIECGVGHYPHLLSIAHQVVCVEYTYGNNAIVLILSHKLLVSVKFGFSFYRHLSLENENIPIKFLRRNVS